MQTVTPAQFNELNTLNQQGIVVISKLSGLLDQEFAALSERDVEKIQSTVQEKTDTLRELEANSKSRNELFAQLQITANKQGLDTFKSSLPSAQQAVFLKHWKPLEELLLEVNDKNQRNETVVNRNSRNLDRLMSIIRGQNQKNMLYDNIGGKGNYSAQQRLGKA
ncbi:flagella synthesis protein FlgN [Aliamphritea ceti]|uniref:flagella synthesis protein FlgN n=1 Tax=Aliamphritea ceti TaxID=1524258 RepID=UPI0021C31783|nr:flagellar protein FlgN [Aliamphritea ceti]